MIVIVIDSGAVALWLSGERAGGVKLPIYYHGDA